MENMLFCTQKWHPLNIISISCDGWYLILNRSEVDRFWCLTVICIIGRVHGIVTDAAKEMNTCVDLLFPGSHVNMFSGYHWQSKCRRPVKSMAKLFLCHDASLCSRYCRRSPSPSIHLHSIPPSLISFTPRYLNPPAWGKDQPRGSGGAIVFFFPRIPALVVILESGVKTSVTLATWVQSRCFLTTVFQTVDIL